MGSCVVVGGGVAGVSGLFPVRIILYLHKDSFNNLMKII